MYKKLQRSVVALATTVACLAIMASPASATTHTGTLTAGTLVAHGVNSVVETRFPLIGSGCVPNTDTVVVDDGTGSTFDVTSYSTTGRFQLTSGSNHYISIFTRLASTPGTVSSTGAVSSATLQLRFDVFLAADQTGSTSSTNCATTGTRICRLTFTLYLGGTASTHPLAASTTLALSAPAATIAVTPPCGVPFTQFNSGTAAIPFPSTPSLSIHLTT